MSTHPKGSGARLLLSSVFGPYAQDDDFGSRSINPMELYHNQVTRMQNEFSIRMFHRSWGLMMIQQNISAPSTLLDFPTREQFAAELKRQHYDIIRYRRSLSTSARCARCAAWCANSRRIRRSSSAATWRRFRVSERRCSMPIPHWQNESISWLRSYLGENPDAPIRHRTIVSGLRPSHRKV